MKTNLTTFPAFPSENREVAAMYLFEDAVFKWKNAFEAEIKDRLQEPIIKGSFFKPEIIEQSIEMGQRDVLRELLGSPTYPVSLTKTGDKE